MKNKYFKILFGLLLFLNSIISYSLPTKNHSELEINGSFYSMDNILTDKGYSLHNENNQLIYLNHGKKISAVQLYAPSIGSDEAIKLYIALKNSIKNAEVYLNEKNIGKTDKYGMMEEDTFRTKGIYNLKLVNLKTRNSSNYIFSLEKSTKLECIGELKLICNKTFY